LPALFHRWLGRRLLVPVVLIGAVLPDYLREFTALLLPTVYYGSIYIFHTIIGALLVSLCGAALVRKDQRGTVFLSLLMGQLLHFLLDIVQGYLCPGRFYLLFPWRYTFETGLIPEQYWLWIFCFSATVFLIFILISRLKSQRNREKERT